MLLGPSTSLADAPCSSDKRSWSTSVLPLSLTHCFASTLPHFSPQDCPTLGCCFTAVTCLLPQNSPLSCRPLSYLRLIAHLETSSWYWIILGWCLVPFSSNISCDHQQSLSLVASIRTRVPYVSQQYCTVIFRWGTRQENSATKRTFTRHSFDCSTWQSEWGFVPSNVDLLLLWTASNC